MISIFIQLKSQALGWRTIKLAVFKTISVANTSSNIDRDGMLLRNLLYNCSSVWSRISVVNSWLYEVRAKQGRRLWMRRLLRQFRHRQLQRTFCSWLVYTETCR